MKTYIFFVFLVAVALARKGFGPGEQEWGYTEVRPGAHMFWWLYYTTQEGNPTDKPLVLWIEGGPGSSSTGYGNFMEFGPLDSDLKPRNYTWVKDCNVMFIDNPVGTGFSYVENSTLLTTNNKQIALDLIEMIKDFYKKFPKFESTPLYILSESYGAKMTAEFALELDSAIKRGEIKANFKAIGLGAPWISPIDSILNWAPYLQHIGMVDRNGYQRIMAIANATQDAINEERWKDAIYFFDLTKFVIASTTYGVDFYNVLKKIPKSSTKDAMVFPGIKSVNNLDNIMNVQVREALGDIPEDVNWTLSSVDVFNSLKEDFLKPVTDIVEKLLNSTDLYVAVFSGQLDLIANTPGTEKWVENLNWKRKESWLRANRRPLVSNGYIEGFIKRFIDIGLYWVNRAGHIIPADNPAGMDAILRDLTKNYSG